MTTAGIPQRPWKMPRRKAPEADLRQTYPKAFWLSVAASAAAHALLFIVFPSFEVEAYEKPQAPVIIELEQIPETRQERRPPPPPRPVVPIPTDSEDIPDDVTIETTELDLFDDLPPPPEFEELPTIEVEEEEEEIVDLWKVEKKPRRKRQVEPEYPVIARKAGIEGSVTVTVLIGKDGKVEAIGQVVGNEIFHEAAKAAAMKTEFTPALQNDKPVKVWVSLPFKFRLN